LNGFLNKARRLSRVLQVPLWREAVLKHRVAASIEHRAILKALGQVNLVVDIGANRGQFSLLVRHLFPFAKIISFEPLAAPAETYRNVFAGDTQVLLFRVAIGPRESQMLFHISARDDCSSLLPISDLQVKTFAGTTEVGTTSVDVSPLSNFLGPEVIVDGSLLKIDVQGYEYQALVGCEKLLNRFSYVYCECSFVELYSGQQLVPEVVGWLAARGFMIKGVYNVHCNSDGVAIQSDFLFERQILLPCSDF
jgi:FkbM family methyltransferase